MKAESVGLYVHVPFCLKKCNYCDFCSFAGLDENIRKSYVSALVKEIKSYKRERKIAIDTVFFGGGTPSLLEPHELEAIYAAMLDSFEFMPDCEFTIEANPKTLTEKKLCSYKEMGVNRISIGLQSIHENELKILGRIHSFDDFKMAYEQALKCGITNVNVDVMYGIPEQTVDSFKKTLDEVARLSPTHISAYGLILEEKTRFWEMRDSLSFPGEDAECDMYELLCQHLRERGYIHYEISNYAKPGCECRHNLKYWRAADYIGVGVAAYSCFEGRRYGNSRELSEYLSVNSTKYVTEELLDHDSIAYECVMLGLRLREGISLSDYKRRFGLDFLSEREDKVKTYINSGYTVLDGDRLSLTEKGFYVSNTILTDLL